MNFTTYFSFEQFKTLYELRQQKENPDDKHSRPIPEFYKKVEDFTQALLDFVIAKNEVEPLMQIEHGATHDTYFQHSWNKILNKEALNQYEADDFRRTFMMLLVMNLHAKDDDAINLPESYNRLIDAVTKGNMASFEINNNDACSNCGQKMNLEFNNWNPSYTTFDLEKNNFVAPVACSTDAVVELSIEFKTGELLIADWFRISEFTKQVEYNKDYKQTSINYSAGREASTRNSVENFNFITVHVGNSCPHIFSHGNNLLFGREDEYTGKKFKDEGYVCTDLWNVTIIEKQQLIDIVANKLGAEKATEVVEKYLAENDYNSVNVSPGIYKLRFHPTCEKFHNAENDKSIPKRIEAMFTLKKDELVHENKRKMKM